MSFFDTIREFFGGAVEEQVNSAVEDVTGQAGDLADQAQSAKDEFLSGREGGGDGSNE